MTVALLLLACASLQGAEDKVAWMLHTNALHASSAQTLQSLPNVLVLGDSISIGYTPFLQKRLSGVANVSHPKCNCCSSQHYLRKDGGMKSWVGTNRWDVITVNCGCWDYCYLKGDPFQTDHYWGPAEEEKKLTPLRRGTSIRSRGFRLRTDVPSYAENLKQILSSLKGTGATVLFALSTPCPSFEQDDRCGLARAYNEVATTVCKELGVTTVDLYSIGEKHYDDQGDGAHYNEKGSDALAAALETEIRKALAEKGRNVRIDVGAKVIADGHRVVSKGEWNGYERTVFELLGCETWIVEPKVEAKGCPWAWIMEWPTAFVKRTGSLALLKAGYHVVTFRPGFYRDGKFESRPGNMNDKRLKESRAFQDYLVSSLGFAPKANLIGMSWGGFYSVRYAATYPDAVQHIYLDAPLLDFSTLKAKGDAFWDLSGKYGVDIKTYVGKDDPRQPVNMYAPIAKAKIPVLLLYGGADATVDPNTNCRRFARALKESGGVIEVVERGPYGHWPHGLELDEQQKFVDFFNGGGRTAEETALDRVRALKLPQAAFTAVRWHPADEKDADGKPSVFAGLGEVRFTAKPSPLSCIRCVVALPPPEKWDGRFQALGTIGAGGFEDVKKTAARARATGSATGYTDLGTSQGIRSDDVLLDYGRRATHILATETKKVIEAFYGRQPKYSYYEGLSTGGQQGVAAAQFHPEDFDGIVATVPAMDRVPLHVYHAWSARQLVDKDGKVVFTDVQLAALEQGGIDWFADKDEPYARGRFVTDSRWTPEAEDGVIACAIRREPSLDDPDLVRRLRNLFRGPTVNGRNVHPGIPFGSRIRYPWGVLFVTNPFLLTWYGLTITGFTDDDMARWMRDWGPSLDAMQTDLSRFKARGGKMVIVGGLADAGVPCGPMADWYEETARTMGGVDKLAECCRLYLVPGRDHCGEVTGISHVSVDIRAWVEKGVDPGVVQGTVRNGEKDERVPVQPYPFFTTGSAASGWGVKEFPRRPASQSEKSN